jgi:hypothetical protein
VYFCDILIRNAGPGTQKIKTYMNGLEDLFPGSHIVLWQTEHIWREQLSDDEKQILLENNIPLTNEKMHLAAIVIDTKNFREIKSYHRIITSPFSKHSQYIKLQLFADKNAEVSTESPLVSLSKDFFRWARGFELYSWGEDYKILSENVNLSDLPSYVETMKFHDIRHLFKAYGIPADDYLASTVIEYFDKSSFIESKSALDNCRLLATALKKLAKTV